MQVNWEQMSTEEIQELIADAQAVLHQREEEERQKVIEKMKELAASVGVSFRLTSGKGKKAKRQPSEKTPPKATLPPKYRNPENPEEIWTGRGRKPPFIRLAEERGEDIEKFRVDHAA
jgi:DNA-binding protein H-NS